MDTGKLKEAGTGYQTATRMARDRSAWKSFVEVLCDT